VVAELRRGCCCCCLVRGSLQGGSVGGQGVEDCRYGVGERGCGRVIVGGVWENGGLTLLWISLYFFGK